MAKTGPPRIDQDRLKRRGSEVYARRKKAEAKKGGPSKALHLPATAVDYGNMRDYLRPGLIPGYDPMRDSDDFVFDPDAAAEAVYFFPQELTHAKGPKFGEPFHLEPWQVAIIANLYGWRHRETGYRRFREAFVFLGRGNGKTAMAAGLILLNLFKYGDDGAEIYGAATEYKQACLVFGHARMMVLNNPKLSEKCRIFRSTHAIERFEEAGFSIYKPIASDSDAAHGFNCSMAVVDELHTQKDANLVEALLTSTGKRKESLVLYITTSDYERESVCNRKHEYASQVRDGIIANPRFLPVIYEASTSDDWTSEEVWKKANPNYDISIFGDYLSQECNRAQADPYYENTFKRLHLNLRTQTNVQLIGQDEWRDCGDEIDESGLEGRPCYCGLDLGRVSDLSAFAMVFPPLEEDGRWDCLVRVWCPKDGLEARERKDGVPLTTWANAGHLEPTPGRTTDQRIVRRRIIEDSERFLIQSIGFDPYCLDKLGQELQEEDGFDLVQFRQGMITMAPAFDEFRKLVRTRTLRHNGSPLLQWSAVNVVGQTDVNGNTMPVKKKSSDKIDPIIALVMGCALAIKSNSKGSIYDSEERGEGLAFI